ncbi:hypothetical protein Sipo8835_01535 [Streptomyces ipomoeae]|nr:hypothetical protein Sipo8835_01535 [Streptomyces ipomoeae]
MRSLGRGWEVGMGALAWLLIPLVAAIGAGLWGGWASRNRKAREDGTELAGYTRFREAMERSHTGG